MPTVADCMTQEIFAVAPDTSVEVAGRLLYAKHISGVPVVDGRGAAIGVVTARDLADPDRARGAELGSRTVLKLRGGPQGVEELDGGPVRVPGRVADVMTTFVVAVPPTTSIDDAAQLMIADNIHRLFVVDDERHVLGVVSAMDLVRVLVEQR